MTQHEMFKIGQHVADRGYIPFFVQLVAWDVLQCDFGQNAKSTERNTTGLDHVSGCFIREFPNIPFAIHEFDLGQLGMVRPKSGTRSMGCRSEGATDCLFVDVTHIGQSLSNAVN